MEPISQSCKRITLIGYRGCGKSTITPLIATQLSWSSIDADDEIERVAGRSIKEIFATGGEKEFRQIERDVMVDLLKQERIVIAAGGGAILNADTRQELPQAGEVIYLRAEVDQLYDRIYQDATTSERRPILTDGGGRAEIVRMLTLREPLYQAAATHVVEVGSSTPEELSDMILKLVNGS